MSGNVTEDLSYLWKMPTDVVYASPEALKRATHAWYTQVMFLDSEKQRVLHEQFRRRHF